MSLFSLPRSTVLMLSFISVLNGISSIEASQNALEDFQNDTPPAIAGTPHISTIDIPVENISINVLAYYYLGINPYGDHFDMTEPSVRRKKGVSGA